jgi:hypothetical protein
MAERPRPPRFNHVAMSVPAELLDEVTRSEILDFYAEVFGWQEAPGMTIDRERLVLMAHRYDQFVFLISDENPMQAPRLDHWGQAVSSRDELDELHERARRYRDKDDRVDIIDLHADSYPGVTIHAFYVRFLLPLMLETQYFEWDKSDQSRSG